MPYRAKVIKVMIASPSDVAPERATVRHVLQEWNNTHSEDKNIVLMAVGWESHSAPAIGDRPQAIINRQMLADCDLLIAVFWTKVGTPTGKAVSGTVEEIEEHVKAKKPAMIYFSSIPVRPDSVDPEQYRLLQEFKAQLRRRGLYAEFDSPEDFRDKLQRHLAQTVLRHFASKKNGEREDTNGLAVRPKLPALSPAARRILLEAAQDKTGRIYKIATMHGYAIETNGKNLLEDQDARTVARWEAGLRELANLHLVEDKGSKGEVFAVADRGYQTADLLQEEHLVPQ